MESATAQIKIGGNVYGGGNQGNVDGTTTVNVRSGNLNKVFGGARMANVGGNAYVNVDGAHASGYMVINYLFGGNDIAGTIGTAAAVSESMPAELTGNKDGVDDTWNTYVHISAKTDPAHPTTYFTSEDISSANVWEPAYGMTTDDVKTSAVVASDNQKVYIGQAFAGGNGDYYYSSTTSGGKTTHNIYLKEGDATPIATKVTDEGEAGFVQPNLAKTYLDVQGGSIVYAYGGGNNATVTEKTVIHVDNPSEVVNEIKVDADGLEDEVSGTNLLTAARFRYDMGINTGFSFPSSDAFQIGRFFGGNNKAEMAIRPTWNLQSGKIRNLYSGGNQGLMSSPEGLLLEVRRNSTIIVDNLYGGCRMADVMPKVNGVYTPVVNLPGYNFPNELSARVLVRGGDINNVYGGNDVTGVVYGGGAVGIYKSIRGDVYGGGNGAYPYTNNASFMDDDIYGDLYYVGTTTDDLNAFRPNAEQVSLRMKGFDAAHPTIIGGSVYCGGNSATLATVKANPMVELKIGSYVIADKVFLGNNGEKMNDPAILERYATGSYNSLDLTDATTFAGYMKGAAMNHAPRIVFDSRVNGDPDDYVDYTSQIGSFFCGGNVGSMIIPGKYSLEIDRGLIVYEKIVGGCNNANIEADTYNAEYKGGILGTDAEQLDYTEGGKIKDRLELNLDNVVIQPKRWKDTFVPITAEDLTPAGKLKEGETYYATNLRTSAFVADGTEDVDLSADDKYYKLSVVGTELEWNTVLWNTDEDDFMSTGIVNTADDYKRRLYGGNIYGGCFNSGHVNGNVIINVDQDVHQKNVLFADSDDDVTITGERRTGVILNAQGEDVQSVAMTLFGAGHGIDTEIWGSTTVNLNHGYIFQIFGGGEEGVVGKKNGSGDYYYDPAYSTTVNLKGADAGYSETEAGPSLAESEYLYGAGNEGDVCGDSYVFMGNGRVYDAFGGASNAEVYGSTEVHIGYDGGFPWVRDNVYGGNDFGGGIRGSKDHSAETNGRTPFDSGSLLSSTYVKYIQGRVDSIFGGGYGGYNYKDRVFRYYTNADGTPRIENGEPVFSFPHMADNSFVHFVPVDNSNNHVNFMFGGSEGYAGSESINNILQERAYTLVDDTETKDVNRFANLDIYGGGAYAGMGTSTSPGGGRAAIDLYAGSFHNVYGGCNKEGLVGYARLNVPAASTVKVNAIFGGGKGYDLDFLDAHPDHAGRSCDHYVTCVDYKSPNAIVEDAIYGGNQNSRVAFDTYVNIEAPVMQSTGYQANVYGGGLGNETVSGRTNVFMNEGSNAYKVFGGGRNGNAFNFGTIRYWLGHQFAKAYPAAEQASHQAEIEAKVVAFGDILRTFGTFIATNPMYLPNKIGTYPNLSGVYDGTYTNDLIPSAMNPTPSYHVTNVHIMRGGNVSGYAYGGGYGEHAVVSGDTYIELKGGNVNRDIYGGGEGGPVYDEYDFALDADATNDFTATTNVYIEGGMARNVYGGGYQGHVGKHTGAISASNANDIPAVANVTIGKLNGTDFYDGIPAILRNAYGGGEGGSVYGTTNLTLNNGYVGYRYKNTGTVESPTYEYVEELDDQTTNAIELAGNVFGGGYVVNSYVDASNVEMYGGTVRGCLYGGGEVGPIGRGTMKSGATGGIQNGKATIYEAGKTHVKLFDGHVKRNVFGGGRGKDSWGGDGTMYMDAELVATLDLKCKGYVFGQTEVDIYGGEVGTDEGVSLGYGNVFGGGDIGCVYSAYRNAGGQLCAGLKPTGSARYDDADEGYYYKYENGAFLTDGDEKILTEDCKLVVEPWCKANTAVTVNGHTYQAGEYVPTSALNYLGNKYADASQWAALGKTDVNKEGVIIHNAVFAGGNTSPGSAEVYANATTVFGNATASIHDVYNRDLISIGRGRVGGLYGDGNLTLVDGYRELNITNYGTDYYHIKDEITLSEYNALPKREAAYYEIRYKCQKQCTDNTGKTYVLNSTITADELLTVFEGVTVGPEPGTPMLNADGTPLAEYWVENGVLSRYAGRPMNTIQRADFCGVFGSRMVMQGAHDRVPETVDYINYTINRVREVSLNKKVSVRPGDSGDPRNGEHGNYFGIYSVVNFLGALTSDVDFHSAVRVTDNMDVDTYQCDANGNAYGTATYFDWKKEFHDERKRNNANSHNKLALASGVYLELTTEKGTGKGLFEKDWGYITGVVELDLINVQPGMGGGYVYAKNEHGIRQNTGKDQTILTALNAGAITNKHFRYDETEANKLAWETSGNFVHSTQTIIDDCYNMGGKYHSGYQLPDGVPAHYWFIKGAVYVYDQYISAFTGSPSAYSEMVSIPLTITSASHGKMTLLSVNENRYAYYAVNSGGTQHALGEDDKIMLRETEYGRNDAINYWDWYQLTNTEKTLFVDQTYIITADCELDGTPYTAGTVILPGKTDSTEVGTYYYLKKHAPTKILKEGDTEETPYVHHVSKDKDVAFDDVFRSSNNVSHDTGYILTYTIDNPEKWNTWYTPKVGTSLTDKIDTDTYESPSTARNNYENGPTYTPTVTGLYGQNDYTVGSVIAADVYNTYQDVKTNHPSVIPANQAKFYPAYVVTANVLETTNKSGTAQLFHKGAALSKEDYADATWTTMSSSVSPAYVVTNTIQLSTTEYLYRGTYLTATERSEYISDYTEVASLIESTVLPAYYCTEAGRYGGNYYQTGHNYRGLAAFSSLSTEDRANFAFNYDALDLLIDPTYGAGRVDGQQYQYDSAAGTLTGAEANDAHYSIATPIDYSATYQGSGSLTYIDDNNTEQTATNGTELSRTEYERLPNEQYHYAPITVDDTDETYYVVKTSIILGDIPYAAGQLIDKDTYDGLNDDDKAEVTTLTFSAAGTYYYCREAYTIPNDDKGHAITSSAVVTGGVTGGPYAKNTEVPKGVVIDEGVYTTLTNDQKGFTIHGLAPTETSTLYVARNSDIQDLSSEKIITVIYQYDYVESDMNGTHITPVSERHILNIHLTFKSGIPIVEDIKAPEIILPGTTISIPEPYVTPGAYEITGAGWKLFDSESDAESHINGIEYTPVSDPLYLYQNNHYMAYYAKTPLGETYSNYVPVSVANYHDLKKVMEKEHHYYIDHKDVIDIAKVDPKIYINDYSGDGKNGLDLLKSLYDLSVLSPTPAVDPETGVILTGDFAGHKPLNSRVKACQNLEFFLRTDIDHSSTSWTPIGNDAATCFEGTFHGDGHALSGLDHSLFDHLCGDVYNLGVMGSFTGAGVAETGDGYVESCWVKTTGTPSTGVKAVFGNPTASGETTVNCYYSLDNAYADGAANKMPDEAFYNGEVAYDLNNFYLYKRYSDHTSPSGTTTDYYYWKQGETDPQVGHYTSHPDECSSGANGFTYVESRFADGDFRYAAGSIPTSADERLYVDPLDATKEYFYPIWPDDYLFFGQKLTYGYSAAYPHDNTPTAIARANGRLSQNLDANRVYRAPAYYRSKVMNVAHFNPHAYLAGKSKDGTKEAHPNMTAIDFAGHNDIHNEPCGSPKAYELGLTAAKLHAVQKFYPPLLDDDGLLSIINIDETQNLLAYAPAEAAASGYANKATHDVLAAYFTEPAYEDYYDNTDNYRLVGDATPVVSSIYGHVVPSDLVSDHDHLLVDKQDFNAPIAYDFDGDHRMWYQRIPEEQEYVDFTKGWQDISLPFTAELVTTNDKGEITHFYGGSSTSKNGTGTKIGHEYWLREFSDIQIDGSEARAAFTYPAAAGDAKDFTNTFLWDYYYNHNVVAPNQQDANTDSYQTYYQSSHRYERYPLLTAAKPYLIGFPGALYYEFDLSGKFVALNTVAAIDKLGRQTITFASDAAAHVNVSDDEMVGIQIAKSGSKDYTFTFKPSYMRQDLTTTDYALNSVGNEFAHVTAAGGVGTPGGATVLPFRPYFTATASAGVKRQLPSRILFIGEYGMQEEQEPESAFNGGLEIYAQGRNIVAKSHLAEATTIRIVTLNGITIANFVLDPGQTVETPVQAHGAYIVNKKKLYVR